jgi:molybdopterin-binding protein
MKLSARNQLKGTIADVVKGATTSHIKIDIGGGVIVTASITNDAVDELKLTKGKPAIAVIKASDVMVGVDDRPPHPDRGDGGGAGCAAPRLCRCGD